MAKKKTKGRLSGRKRARQQRRRRMLQQRLLQAAIGLIVVLLVAGVIYMATGPKPGKAVRSLGNAHIQPPQEATYNTRPPTSGSHFSGLARWGVHSEPIVDELAVHNLEDGGVLMQYDCPDGCDALIGQFVRVMDNYDSQVIIAPYPDMETRIALTAWGQIDAFDEFDEDRIVQFIQAYRGIDHHSR
jgi:hypothetical protein